MVYYSHYYQSSADNKTELLQDAAVADDASKTDNTTHHESVAVLDQNVPCPAVALEETLQIALPHAVGQTSDVDS